MLMLMILHAGQCVISERLGDGCRKWQALLVFQWTINDHTIIQRLNKLLAHLQQQRLRPILSSYTNSIHFIASTIHTNWRITCIESYRAIHGTANATSTKHEQKIKIHRCSFQNSHIIHTYIQSAYIQKRERGKHLTADKLTPKIEARLEVKLCVKFQLERHSLHWRVSDEARHHCRKRRQVTMNDNRRQSNGYHAAATFYIFRECVIYFYFFIFCKYTA